MELIFRLRSEEHLKIEGKVVWKAASQHSQGLEKEVYHFQKPKVVYMGRAVCVGRAKKKEEPDCGDSG